MGLFDAFKPKQKTQIVTESNRPISLNTVVNAVRSAIYSGGYDDADSMHQIYEDFGYPERLTFENFWNMYRRFGVAKGVVDILVDLTWVDSPVIRSENEQFAREFNELVDRSYLWNRLKGLDRRQRVGRYAGMYVQVKDNKTPDKPLGKLSGVNSIVKLVPLYEGQLEVMQSETDPTKENYDEPIMYQYKGKGTGSRNDKSGSSFQVHPSRLIMAAEGADDGSIYGISSLECVYNDLMDLRKISGAGGEGYYQNTRNAPVFKADDEFSSEDNQEQLAEAIDEWLGKHRKRLVLKGIEPKFPNIQLTDPKEFYQNSINNIAAGSGIPSAFLIGQQTGRLASDKDSRHLMTLAQSRRDNFLTLLVEQFLNWCINHAVLPFAEYTIEWGDLLTLSDDEKVEVVRKMSEINQKQFLSGMQPVFSEEEMRARAGYSILPEDLPDERSPEELGLVEPEAEKPAQEEDDVDSEPRSDQTSEE